jgi:hypothetical protein
MLNTADLIHYYVSSVQFEIDQLFISLVQVCENFDDMNLKEELLRGIYAYGFEKPSAIQQRAIVPCIKVGTVFILFKALLNYKKGAHFNVPVQTLCLLCIKYGCGHSYFFVHCFSDGGPFFFVKKRCTGGIISICLYCSREVLIQIGVVKCNNLCSSSVSD